MTEWDSAAEVHLKDTITTLQELGVAQLFEEQVATVWRRNVDAYDPQLGDTPRSLGVTCSENLRELILRACASTEVPWPAGDVVGRAVDNSLRLEARGTRLALMKAPPSSVRTPDWASNVF